MCDEKHVAPNLGQITFAWIDQIDSVIGVVSGTRVTQNNTPLPIDSSTVDWRSKCI